MARAPGATKLDALLEGGFSDEEMIEYKRSRTQALTEGGFSSDDINQYWGTPEPDTASILQWTKDTIDTFLDETIGEDIEGERPSIGETLIQGFRAGAQESVGGLLMRGRVPDITPPDSVLGAAVSGTTSVIADLPIMIPAGIGGAIAGLGGGPAAPLTVPAGAMGAAFAVPAGMRTSLIDSYNNGSYTSVNDFLERTWNVYFETAKAFVTGASTGAAGSLAAPGFRRLASEVVTLTTVQQGLEGQIPGPRDFIDTAAVLTGLKIATKVSEKAVELEDVRRRTKVELKVKKNLERVYVKTGRQPQEILEDATFDPTILEDILSDNIDVPRAYREEVAPEAPVSIAGKGTVVEGKLPPNVVETYTKLSEKSTETLSTVLEDYRALNPGQTAAVLTNAGELLSRMVDSSETGVASVDIVKSKVTRLLTTLKAESFQPGGGESIGSDILNVSKGRNIDLDTHTKEVNSKLKEYAEVNKDFPVYNESQWLAREIAVSIGEKRYDDAIQHLEDLNTIVNDGAYTERALAYESNAKGKLTEFSREFDISDPTEIVTEFNVEKQKPKEEGEEVPLTLEKTPEKLAAEEKAKERGTKEKEETFDLETAQGRILNRISTGSTGKKINVKETLNTIYEQSFDAMHPLKRLVDVLTEGKEIPAGSDPYKLARVSVASASRSEMALTKEQRNFSGEVIGPALSQILSPLKNNVKETEGLRAYLVAKTQLTRKDPKTKIDLEDAQSVVKAGEQKYGKMGRALVDYQSNLVQLLVDSGRAKKSTVKKLDRLNDDFIPWHLLMDEKVPQNLGKVIDPLESVVKNTYTYNHLAIQNHVGRSLIELAETRSDLIEGVMEKITPDPKQIKVKTKELEPIVRAIKEQFGIEFTPEELMIFRTERRQVKKDQEVAIYRRGEREIWSLPPDVARVFNSLDRSTVGLLVKFLSIPAKTLRAGAILNPEFTGRNVFRDTIFAGITSKSGFIPGWDTVVGLRELFKDGDVYRDWLFAGGAQATIVSVDRTYLSQNLKEVLDKTNIRSSVRNLIMDEGRNNISSRFSPIEALRVLSELGENATRLGEAKRATAKLKKQPELTDFDIKTEAAFRAREVTDFGRMGSKMSGANMLVAFLNAKLQGEDRAIRAFIDKPAKATFIATATITLPTVLLWWNNKDDPRYQALPQWMKDLFWIILTDDRLYRVPKAHTLGLIFGSIPERILNERYADGPDAFKDLGSSFGLDQVSGFTPQFAIPFIEEFVDHSLSRDRPLLGATERFVPELRSTPYTTELIKAMGKVLAQIPGMELSNYTSPIVIDNFVRQWSGGLGVYTMQLLDKAARESGIIPDPVKPTVPFEQQPFVKAFTIRHPSFSTSHSDEFYERFKQKKQIHDSFQELAERGDFESAKRIAALDPSAMVELTEMRQTMLDMRKLIVTIPRLSISPDEMRQQIDIAMSAMTGIAKLGNTIMDQMEDALEGSFDETPKAVIDPNPIPGTISLIDESVTPDPVPQSAIPKIPDFDIVEIKTKLSVPGIINKQLQASDGLIASVVKQESNGNSKAISRRKDGTPVAYGLMQITLPTAKNPGFGLPGIAGTDSEVIKKLLDPKINKQFGTQFLNALLHKYGGNVFYALLAYHSGSEFIDKWIKSGSNPNKMGKQGRNYVKRISNTITLRGKND